MKVHKFCTDFCLELGFPAHQRPVLSAFQLLVWLIFIFFALNGPLETGHHSTNTPSNILCNIACYFCIALCFTTCFVLFQKIFISLLFKLISLWSESTDSNARSFIRFFFLMFFILLNNNLFFNIIFVASCVSGL